MLYALCILGGIVIGIAALIWLMNNFGGPRF